MEKFMAFCMVGGHSVEVSDAAKLPEGWKLVKASVIQAPSDPLAPWSPGIWYADESSPASILACPEHEPVRL